MKSAIGAVVILANLGLLLVLLGLPPGFIASPTRRGLYLALAALTVGGALLLAIPRLLRPLSDASMARLIDAECSLGDRVLTAVELGRDQVGAHAPSKTLVALHRAAVERQVHDVDPRQVVSFAPLIRPLQLLAVLMTTLALVAALSPQSISRYVAALSASDPAPPMVAASAPTGFTPMLGQIELTYRYPAYTGWPDKRVVGATGDLEAIRGTEVELSAVVDTAVAAAWLDLGADTVLPLAVHDGRQVTGRLVIHEPGSYRAAFRRADDGAWIDPWAHAIVVDDDLFPNVTLHDPEADLELDELASIEVAWSADDDFALGEANLVVTRDGREERTRLAVDAGAREAGGRFTWTSGDGPLEAGDELVLYVEVFDNDTVSGPKRVESERRHVRVRSAADIHDQTIAAIDRLLDELLGSLSLSLTAPSTESLTASDRVPQLPNSFVDFAAALEEQESISQRMVAAAELERTVNDRLSNHVGAIDEILRGLWNDVLGTEATYTTLSEMRIRVEALHAERESFLKREVPVLRRAFAAVALARAIEQLRTRTITSLESEALLLDDLVYREKSEVVRQLADRLMRDQERLTGLLDEYKRTGDERTKAEIDRLLAKSQRDLAELQARMAELGGPAVDEFMNLEAVRKSLGPDASATLAELGEQLQNGDIDKALEQAEQLQGSLRETMKALEGDLRNTGPLAGQSMFEQATRAADRLVELVKAEGKLIDETDELDRQIENRRFGTGSDPSEFYAERAKRMTQLAEDIAATREALVAEPSFAEVNAKAEQLRLLEAEIVRRQLEQASIAEIDAIHRRALRLRDEVHAGGYEDERDAWQALVESEQLARDAGLALSGRSLDRSLELSSSLRMALGDVRRSLGRASDERKRGSVGGEQSTAERTRVAHEEALDLARDLSALDELLRRSPGGDATAEDSAALSELARRQMTLRNEADEIGRELDELSAESAEFPPELSERLEQAGQYMEIASRMLEHSDSSEGLRNEREAKARLEEALQSVQQSAQQCEQGGGSQAGGRGESESGGRESGFAFIPSGVGGEPRFQRERGRDGQRDGGFRGSSQAHVDLPPDEQALAPEEFRRDVLEGMKGPRPEGYEAAIDAYYRRLVQ